MLSSQEKQHPIDIDTGVAEKFKDFRTDIQKFSTDFLQYLKDKKQDFEERVERLRSLINRLTSELDVYVLCSRCVLFNS